MAIYPNQPSEVTVRLLERKSNTIIEDITPMVRYVNFTEKLRRSGFGKLEVLSEDLSVDSREAIINGNASIQVIRDTVEVRPQGANQNYTDEFTGPVVIARLKDGDFINQKLDFTTVRNEIVVLGNGTGASRAVTRVAGSSSQSTIGMRELIVDGRNTSTSAERTALGNATLTESLEVARVISAGGKSKGNLVFELAFADNKIYMNYRNIGCTGVATIDPGNVKAGNYIRSILNDNLITPQSASHDNAANRQIDVPAIIGTYDGVGNDVDMPLRWNNLSSAVEQACYLGEVGVTSEINDSNQIVYTVIPHNDRTSGTTNGVVWNRDNSEASWDVRVGDKITVEEYLSTTSSSPEIEPADFVCVGRTINMQRGREDVVNLEIGGEIQSLNDQLKRQFKTINTAQYV